MSKAQGCEEEYPNGFTEVDGVPIVDVLSFGLRLAEVLASFDKAGLPWISRADRYKHPPEDLMLSNAEDYPYEGPPRAWHY